MSPSVRTSPSQSGRFGTILPIALGALSLIGAGGFLTGCAWLERGISGPAVTPAAPRPAAEPTAAEPFSSEFAFAHLRALTELGPRPAGTAASLGAAEYIRTRLEALGLEVNEAEAKLTQPAEEGSEGEPVAVTLRHLAATIPADSPDEILLLAHYDTGAETPGANDGASGPAILLELARQLVERPLPYQVQLWFLDGEAGAPPAWPDLPKHAGIRGLVASMEDAESVRLAVFFRQVCDADLAIARDRFSDRLARDEFFTAAKALGHGAAFPMDRGFTDITSSHTSLWKAGVTHVVSIMDPWYGGDEPPGPLWGGADDTVERCSAESLQTVGEVSLLALRRISARLQKVDRLSGRAERRAAEVLEPPEVEGEAVEDQLETEEAAEARMLDPAEAAPDAEADPQPAPEAEVDPEAVAPGDVDAAPTPSEAEPSAP